MRSGFSYVVTCEHASPEVPKRWQPVLGEFVARCEEHRIWDPGAKEIARDLGRLLHAPVYLGEVSRLLVEMNRSLTHNELFSPPVEDLSPVEKTEILCRYYYPYRHRVLQEIESQLSNRQRVIHLSIHSFAPVVEGRVRDNDFGLLFDPWRKAEKDIAEIWLHYLRKAGEISCRANEPYLGISDGHVPVLRKLFRQAPYFGFELEFNQKLPLERDASLYARWIHRSLDQALESKVVDPHVK